MIRLTGIMSIIVVAYGVSEPTELEDDSCDTNPSVRNYVFTSTCNATVTTSDESSQMLIRTIENLSKQLNERIDNLTGDILDLKAKVSALDNSEGRQEWKKAKFYVYQVADPYVGYKYNKEEAQAACEQSDGGPMGGTLGGTLATLLQLEAAFNAGMDFCACGWLADGTAGYPIQIPRQGCSIGSPPGVRICGSVGTFNAWCVPVY